MSDRPGVDTWTAGRICDHLERGLTVPADWRERLARAGYKVPDVQLSLGVGDDIPRHGPCEHFQRDPEQPGACLQCGNPEMCEYRNASVGDDTPPRDALADCQQDCEGWRREAAHLQSSLIAVLAIVDSDATRWERVEGGTDNPSLKRARLLAGDVVLPEPPKET